MAADVDVCAASQCVHPGRLPRRHPPRMTTVSSPLTFRGWFCGACGKVCGSLQLCLEPVLTCLRLAQTHTRADSDVSDRAHASARQEPSPKGLIVLAEQVAGALQKQVRAAGSPVPVMSR
jgi:hypothetical protein